VRALYRFSSTEWSRFAADGFNAVTDGGAHSYGAAERAAGLTGMVWVPAYDNSSCAQIMSDAQIAQSVQDNVAAGSRGLVYQLGDEPTTNGCPAAPTYTHMTAVVHAADPTARTWVADDQFNDPAINKTPGVPMKGTVDILAFDIYPCMDDNTAACHLDMIDNAVGRIHAAGVTSWQFIMQDFGGYTVACSGCIGWRWPTNAELSAQFAHWQNAGASGYWVFAWDYDKGSPVSVTSMAGNEATLRAINALPLNG
jgi:hypothetical protein